MQKVIACENEEKHEELVEQVRHNIVSKAEIEQVGRIFRVLSEPSRLTIVLALLQGDMCVYHLTEACNTTQSAMSHQLRVLRDNNIVKTKRNGKNIEYSIADEHISKIVRMGLEHLHCDSEK